MAYPSEKGEKSSDGYGYPQNSSRNNPFMDNAPPGPPPSHAYMSNDQPPPSYSAQPSYPAQPPQGGNAAYYSDQSPGVKVPRYVAEDDISGPEPTDDDILRQALEFTRHGPPPAYRASALAIPVVVPQTQAGTGKPFARCYSPALLPYNIPEADFVEFIDNLNVVSTANPPLQILDLVGGVLGFVPSGAFQLASAGISAVAKIGQVVVSKTRTDTYMKEVNKTFFGPRGLKASIATPDAVARALKLPNGTGDLPPITNENMNVSMMERRVQTLRPYMSPLHFLVPPPAQQTTILAKMSAGQVKRQLAKSEKKALEGRQKQVDKVEKVRSKDVKEGSKEQKKYGKEMEKIEREIRKAEKHAERDARKGGREAQRAEGAFRDDMRKIESDRIKVEREYGGGGGGYGGEYEGGYSGQGNGSYRSGYSGQGNGNYGGERAGESSRKVEKVIKNDKEIKEAMKALWILIENL